MTDSFTEIVNGKRQWKQTMYLAEKFDLYHRNEEYSHYFFVDVFKGELGLKESAGTTYISKHGINSSNGLSVGDRVYVFPFATSVYKWVVKGGDFEKVVDDMEKVFEIIREAWEFNSIKG